MHFRVGGFVVQKGGFLVRTTNRGGVGRCGDRRLKQCLRPRRSRRTAPHGTALYGCGTAPTRSAPSPNREFRRGSGGLELVGMDGGGGGGGDWVSDID